MALTTAGKNTALGALVIDEMRLHTGAPGDAGTANLATGGGYTNQACTFDNPISGSRSLSGNVTFDVATGTYSHYSLWAGATCVDVGALASDKVMSEAGQIEVTAGSVSLT